MASVAAGWGSGLEDVGSNWLLGPDGLLATLVTFMEFVTIPYLVVILTARSRQPSPAEETPPDHLDAVTGTRSQPSH
jgi:hypothetical protein